MTNQTSEVSVSFVVPVYNAEEFLVPCVESILAQTCPDFEVILVDDGSTDGSGAQCDAFAAKDARIRVLHQANAGVSAARNAGMDAANGRWLVFVDADDWVAPEYVTQISLHDAPDNDLILFNYADALPDKLIPHHTPGGEKTLGAAELADARCAVLNRYHRGCLNYLQVHMTGPWAKAYRRKAVQATGLQFPPGIISGEDTYFNFLFLAVAHGGVFVPETIYCYRKNTSSVTQRYNPALAENFRRVDALYRQYFAANPLQQATFQADYQLYLTSCCMFITLQDCCHPDNPHPRKERRAAFRQLCGSSIFSAALKSSDLTQYSPQKALICRLLRLQAFDLLCLLDCVQNRSERSKNPNHSATK